MASRSFGGESTTSSLLLLNNEVVCFEAAAVSDRPEVLTQVQHLAVSFELKEEHTEGETDEAEQQVRIDVHLSPDVGRMLQAVPRTKNTLLVKVAHQEGILGGQAEGPKLVLVVHKTNWSLSKSALRCTWQVLAVNLSSSEQFKPAVWLSRVLECTTCGEVSLAG